MEEFASRELEAWEEPDVCVDAAASSFGAVADGRGRFCSPRAAAGVDSRERLRLKVAILPSVDLGLLLRGSLRTPVGAETAASSGRCRECEEPMSPTTRYVRGRNAIPSQGASIQASDDGRGLRGRARTSCGEMRHYDARKCGLSCCDGTKAVMMR